MESEKQDLGGSGEHRELCFRSQRKKGVPEEGAAAVPCATVGQATAAFSNEEVT